MGAWGEDILENDLSLDMYYWFMDLYDENVDLIEIHDEVVSYYDNEPLSQIEMRVDFWTGLAQAEWECGYYNDETLKEIYAIIQSKGEMDEWHEARFEILLDFSKKISAPNPKPRPRQPKIPEQETYPEGTCLAVELGSLAVVRGVGGYGGAIILRNIYHDKYYCSTLIGGLKGVFDEPPTMEIFEIRDWLYLTHHNFTGKLNRIWSFQDEFTEYKDEHKIIVVGQTEIRNTDPIAEIYQTDIGRSGIGWIQNQIWKQAEWDKNH